MLRRPETILNFRFNPSCKLHGKSLCPNGSHKGIRANGLYLAPRPPLGEWAPTRYRLLNARASVL